MPPTALLGRDADVRTLRDGSPITPYVASHSPAQAGWEDPSGDGDRSCDCGRAPRVVFVPLAAIRNPAFVASAIAEALGLTDVTAVDLPARVRVACDVRRRCSCSTISSRCWTRRRWSRSSWPRSVRFACWSPAAPPYECAASGSAPIGTARAGCWTRTRVARRPGAVSRGAPVRGARSGRRTWLSPDARERRHRDRDLSAARCAPARSRAGRALDQSADGRGTAAAARRAMCCSRPSVRAISPNANRR